MFIDKNLELFDDVALPDQTTDDSEALDLHTDGETLRESLGEPMEILLQIRETATSAGAATLKADLISGTSAAFANANIHYSTPVIALAELVAGKKIRLPLSFSELDADATHLGVRITGGTADFTAGKIAGWIQRAGEDQS